MINFLEGSDVHKVGMLKFDFLITRVLKVEFDLTATRLFRKQLQVIHFFLSWFEMLNKIAIGILFFSHICYAVNRVFSTATKMRELIQKAVNDFCPFSGNDNKEHCIPGFEPVNASLVKEGDSSMLINIGLAIDPFSGTLLIPSIALTAGSQNFTSNTGKSYIVPNECTLTLGDANGTFVDLTQTTFNPQYFIDRFMNFDSSPSKNFSWSSGYDITGSFDSISSAVDFYRMEYELATIMATNYAYNLALKNIEVDYIRSVLNDYANQALDLLSESPGYDEDPETFELFWITWGNGISVDSDLGGMFQAIVSIKECLLDQVRNGSNNQIDGYSLEDVMTTDIPDELRVGPTVSSSTLETYQDRRNVLLQEYRGSTVDMTSDPNNLQGFVDGIQDAPIPLRTNVIVKWSDIHTDTGVQQSLLKLESAKKSEQYSSVSTVLQPVADVAQNNPHAFGFTEVKWSGTGAYHKYMTGGIYLKDVDACASACYMFQDQGTSCGTSSTPCWDGYYRRFDNITTQVATCYYYCPYYVSGPMCVYWYQFWINGDYNNVALCTGGYRWNNYPPKSTTDWWCSSNGSSDKKIQEFYNISENYQTRTGIHERNYFARAPKSSPWIPNDSP